MMAFTIDTWKDRAAGKLSQAGRWLDDPNDLPFIVYGTIVGLSLWPLAQQAAESGSLANVLMALYSVTAGEGANLIASQIEAWKDRGQPPAEAEVVAWLAGQAQVNDDLRQALDAVLEQFDAVAQAQAALPENERAWFVETLSAELGWLGNLERFQAQLIGSGAIARGDGAVAVGRQGSYVGRDAGMVVTGGTVVYAEQGAKSVAPPIVNENS